MQRKAKQREELNLKRYETPSDSSDAEQAVNPSKQAADTAEYQEGDTFTTVTTAVLHLDSDRYISWSMHDTMGQSSVQLLVLPISQYADTTLSMLGITAHTQDLSMLAIIL